MHVCPCVLMQWNRCSATMCAHRSHQYAQSSIRRISWWQEEKVASLSVQSCSCLVVCVQGFVCVRPRGVLKFGFGRDVPPWNLKVDPYKYQFFKKKYPIHIPIGSISGQILNKITNFFQNFLKFEPILAQIWPNFEKSTHSYTRFCIL